MSIKSLDAASAYAQALNSNAALGKADPAGLLQGSEETGRSTFGSMLEEQIGDLKNATQASEMTAAKAIAGQSDLVDVVTAASNAELVVTTMTAVRDKVLTSYNEIIKMPI